MQYHGTDIDGVFLSPDRLEVRGLDLSTIIASFSYPEAICHIFTGGGRDEALARALDKAFIAALTSLPHDAPPLKLIAEARKAGANQVQAITAGLMAPSSVGFDERVAASLGLEASVADALALVAVLPAYARAAAAGDPAEAPASRGGTYLEHVHSLFAPAADAAGAAALERAFVAWHGGFGYLPPSVMMPRISIGTGVPIRQALAAGLAAGGPKHIGATEHAHRLLRQVLADAGGPEDIAASAAAAVAAMLNANQHLPGFGHPLFQKDPRPEALLAAAHPYLDGTDIGIAVRALIQAAKEAGGLEPNIDAVSAGLFLRAGIGDSETAAVLSLCARAVAMLAHIAERLRKPAFGVNSAIAREYLHTLPQDWL